MLLYIIRHGDPIYDPDSLTELGHKQAEELSKRFEKRGFDKIFSSPMIRAQQTAEPTCKKLGMTYSIEEWASENKAHEYLSMIKDGRRIWIFAQQNTNYYNEETMNMNWYDIPAFQPGDKQRYIDRFNLVRDGGNDFLERLGYKREGMLYRAIRPNNDRIALFAHEGISKIWLPSVLNVPPQMFWATTEFSHTGVTVLEFKSGEDGLCMPKILTLSDLSHIYASDLPYTYQNRLEI